MSFQPLNYILFNAFEFEFGGVDGQFELLFKLHVIL